MERHVDPDDENASDRVSLCNGRHPSDGRGRCPWSSLEPAVRVHLLSAPPAKAADLLKADGYIFATPENLAAIAGLMKDFFDRTYYPALDQISDVLTRC